MGWPTSIGPAFSLAVPYSNQVAVLCELCSLKAAAHACPVNDRQECSDVHCRQPGGFPLQAQGSHAAKRQLHQQPIPFLPLEKVQQWQAVLRLRDFCMLYIGMLSLRHLLLLPEHVHAATSLKLIGCVRNVVVYMLRADAIHCIITHSAPHSGVAARTEQPEEPVANSPRAGRLAACSIFSRKPSDAQPS